MPHFSFYQVLTDNVVLNLPNFDPNNSDENLSTQRVRWTPPGDMVTSTDGEKRPVLCYNVDLDDADGFVLEVQIRDLQGVDRTISNFSYGGNTTRQVMEPFRTEWVRRNEQNKIFFRQAGGNGGVQIRNVMMLTTRFRDF